jgi:hypothetical protein
MIFVSSFPGNQANVAMASIVSVAFSLSWFCSISGLDLFWQHQSGIRSFSPVFPFAKFLQLVSRNLPVLGSGDNLKEDRPAPDE